MKLFALALCLSATTAHAEMIGKLLPPWDGETVPVGQQCKLFQGAGMTPPMDLRGLPEATTDIHLEFNDLSYKPLSTDGGHGIIGFKVSEPDVILPAVKAMTSELDEPAYLVAKARSQGEYASSGYLPPCSGGAKNEYSVTIKALDVSGTVLETLVLPLGRY